LRRGSAGGVAAFVIGSYESTTVVTCWVIFWQTGGGAAKREIARVDIAELWISGEVAVDVFHSSQAADPSR